MFRYSGSKKRMIKFLPKPNGQDLIVEPFAGSLAYSLFYKPKQILAAESNPLVRNLWEWLRTKATAKELSDLELLKPTEKVQAASLGLDEPQTTLIRLTISGAYVGQLSSTVLYNQHSMNFDKIRDILPYIQKSLMPMLESYEQCFEEHHENALFFIDPPYLNTKANYKSKGNDHGGLDAKELEAKVKELKSDFIFTYGDGATETFPSLAWQLATIRKVPNLRRGGTVDRKEFFATKAQ